MVNSIQQSIALFCFLIIPINAQEPLTIKAAAPPRYPWIGRLSNITGIAEVAVNVGADGKVISIDKQLSKSTHPAIVANAELFARRWVFSGQSSKPLVITFEYRLVPRDPSKTLAEQEYEYSTEFVSPRKVIMTSIFMPKETQ